MELTLSKLLVLFLVANRICNTSGHVRYQRTVDSEEGTTPAPNAKYENDKNCSICPGEASCVAKVQCPALMRPGANAATCHLPGGRDGVCCTTGRNHTTQEDLKKGRSSSVEEKHLDDAKSKSKLKLAKLAEKEQKIIANEKHKTVVTSGQPTFGHFQSTKTANWKKSAEINNVAMENLFALKMLKERQSISDDDLSLGLTHIVMEDSPCPPKPKCDNLHSKYRTVDGTCNNVMHTTWGAAKTATERLLPPNYDDGIWSPRKSVLDKTPLKSARKISNTLIPDKNRPHSHLTLLTMQFGQFVSHDISSSVTLMFSNGSAISCCSEDGSSVLPPELSHFGCLPIEIHDDEFFSQFNQKCMNFVRTQLAPNHDCSLGYAKQMNGITHYLDLSHVYGSDAEALGPLREWSGGRMKMFNDFGRELLPLSEDKNDCITMVQGSACFKSGDGHVNQMIGLVAVHTIFTREHNRVAGILSKLNPHWSEQLIFLEARKVVISEFQHIIYNEWLPLVVGEKTVHEFNLKSKPHHEYSFDYDQFLNPSLTAEFSVAAFRFGHSNVDGHLKIPNMENLEEIIAISEVMFHPARMRVKQFYDRLLKSLTSQPLQETDPSLTKMLTKYMFRGGQPFGLDLASLNIQRGRDHGLRSYNDYRQLVGLPKMLSFDEFGPKVAEHLKEVYHHVDDIDLWIGGLLEAPEGGALVGYTFKEMIADQFSRLKHGDRYFYEHSPTTNPGHFRPAQLAEIKKVTMSRLICDNSDHIELLTQSPNAFVRHDIPGNEPIDCQSPDIPFLDLSPWKEV